MQICAEEGVEKRPMKNARIVEELRTLDSIQFERLELFSITWQSVNAKKKQKQIHIYSFLLIYSVCVYVCIYVGVLANTCQIPSSFLHNWLLWEFFF